MRESQAAVPGHPARRSAQARRYVGAVRVRVLQAEALQGQRTCSPPPQLCSSRLLNLFSLTAYGSASLFKHLAILLLQACTTRITVCDSRLSARTHAHTRTRLQGQHVRTHTNTHTHTRTHTHTHIVRCFFSCALCVSVCRSQHVVSVAVTRHVCERLSAAGE